MAAQRWAPLFQVADATEQPSLLLGGTGSEEALEQGTQLPQKDLISPGMRRLAAGAAAAAVILGAAALVSLGSHEPALRRASARSVERKFYDESGAYWQAPGRGISTSELWNGCGHPHLRQCGSYCCCDQGHYWKSPKTLYQQGKSIAAKAAAGAAVKETEAAEGAVKEAVVAAGEAAFASLLSEGQECVPQADVPNEVVKALEDAGQIPGSGEWATCSTFTSNSHTCGSFCCCNGGHKWDTSSKACMPE